jgi:amino acid transporter
VKKSDDATIATVISCIISIFLSFMVFTQDGDVSKQKLDFLFLMIGVYIVVYFILAIIRMLINKDAKSRKKE